MTDKPQLKLDKAGLQDFIDHQIVPFSDSLDKIANARNEQGVTMDDLLGLGQAPDGEKWIFREQPPIPLGFMANDGEDHGLTSGAAVKKSITDVATSVSHVYTQQIKLFKDLHQYLGTTIQKLMDGQHDSLDKIDGKVFLDSLGTVPSDFQPTNGQNGGS
jgi:hypothetical protein